MRLTAFFICALQAVISLPGTAQTPQPASGRIVRMDTFPSDNITERTIDVWLPDGYPSAGRYAVLYMHDGQMLYDSSVTWNHQEWGVDEMAGELVKTQRIRPCIIVVIHNGGSMRHSEYFPQKPFEMLNDQEQKTALGSRRPDDQPVFSGPVRSDDYLRFLVRELKPYIDSAFSTDPSRRSTFVAGSSMGGLISLYAICEYPKVFGGAACLSTHWPGTFGTLKDRIPETFMHYLRKHLPSPRKHKLYFDFGTETLDSFYKPYQVRADEIIKEKGYTPEQWMTREFPGEDHSENAWRKRLDTPLVFLLGSTE